jgi:hypothetical protein
MTHVVIQFRKPREQYRADSQRTDEFQAPGESVSLAADFSFTQGA